MNAPIICATIGWLFIIIGIVILFIAAAIIFFKFIKGRVKGFRGGGILVFGPIPIIFGTDREIIKTLMVLVIILIIVMLAFLVAILIL